MIRRFVAAVVRVGLTLAAVVVIGGMLMGGLPSDVDLTKLGATDTPNGVDQPIDQGPVGEELGTATARPSSTPADRNPWGREPVVVGVRTTVDTDRNISSAVAAALDYWASNRRYGEYAVNFTLDPDAENPDVRVWYNASISCEYHIEAVGCAPLLSADSRVPDTVPIQIKHNESTNRRQVLVTLTHEFGHVLGISHCEPPHWVMGSGCREKLPAAPDVDDRPLAWRESNLTVHVDYSRVAEENLEATEDQVGHALTYFESGRAENFPASVSITQVDERWLADITIDIGDAARCDPDAPACTFRFGRDFDRDGRFEYYTRAQIFLRTELDVEARGWFVGWALAHQLAPGHIPPVFEDAGYRERRSDWWE